MKVHRVFCCAVSLALLVGCGSNGLPRAQDVTVTVTPASANIPAGGTLTLIGSGTGFASPPEIAPPFVMWGIQGSSDGHPPVTECGLLATQDPAISVPLCPNGYVMFGLVTDFPSTAVYHAPSKPGVYHVVFTVTQSVMYSSLQKSAAAEITVTP